MPRRPLVQVSLLLLASISSVVLATGCTAIADANQKPPVSNYAIQAPKDKVFTAAVQTLGSMGKVITSDRESGVVQGQKGNWVVNVGLAAASSATDMNVSVRYVPSSQMDFNSREGITKEFVTSLEAAIKTPVTPVQ